MLNLTYRALKILVVSVIGVTLIAFGIVLLVTPGPGWALIFAGLAVLAVEFVWARQLLKRLKRTLEGVARNVSTHAARERSRARLMARLGEVRAAIKFWWRRNVRRSGP